MDGSNNKSIEKLQNIYATRYMHAQLRCDVVVDEGEAHLGRKSCEALVDDLEYYV